MVKRLIIRWSNKQLAKLINEGWTMSYHDFGRYGIADWLINEHTGEPMLVLDGVEPRPSHRPTKDNRIKELQQQSKGEK